MASFCTIEATPHGPPAPPSFIAYVCSDHRVSRSCSSQTFFFSGWGATCFFILYRCIRRRALANPPQSVNCFIGLCGGKYRTEENGAKCAASRLLIPLNLVLLLVAVTDSPREACSCRRHTCRYHVNSCESVSL